jgi:Mn-containing catalase
MREGKRKDDAPADLGLIGAALRVEHYEIAAYTSARNLALQLHQREIADLLSLTLGEEENAGQLLNQVAQPLMSAARMPAAVE